ncbi:MAG: hypothetical protein ACEQSQ_00085 [Candidatus Paceibacteria bacterium]
MELFEGYVLQAELAEKANVSNSALCAVSCEKKKMGGLACLKISDLPERYKDAAKQCTKLDTYLSYNYLSKALGMSRDFLCTTDYDRAIKEKALFESKKTGSIRLFKLNEEFISCVKKGLSPFKIKDKDDEEYAKEIIEMQGLKIGFY